MNTDNSRTLIFWITGGLVIVLVVSAFALSYGAVYGLALSYGWPTWGAILSPLMLDFFVVVGKMDILRRSLDKARTRYPWTLVIIFSLLAVLFNVLHATPDTWTPDTWTLTAGKQLFASLPPVVVLLAFHLFVEQLKARLSLPVKVSRTAGQRARIEPDIVQEDVPESVQPIVQDVQPVRRTIEFVQVKVSDRRALIPALVREGMTPLDIAGHFDVSEKTIRRDLVALNGAVANGHKGA